MSLSINTYCTSCLASLPHVSLTIHSHSLCLQPLLFNARPASTHVAVAFNALTPLCFFFCTNQTTLNSPPTQAAAVGPRRPPLSSPPTQVTAAGPRRLPLSSPPTDVDFLDGSMHRTATAAATTSLSIAHNNTQHKPRMEQPPHQQLA